MTLPWDVFCRSSGQISIRICSSPNESRAMSTGGSQACRKFLRSQKSRRPSQQRSTLWGVLAGISSFSSLLTEDRNRTADEYGRDGSAEACHRRARRSRPRPMAGRARLRHGSRCTRGQRRSVRDQLSGWIEQSAERSALPGRLAALSAKAERSASLRTTEPWEPGYLESKPGPTGRPSSSSGIIPEVSRRSKQQASVRASVQRRVHG